LKDKGFIYKGFHEGWYCVSDEAFYPESQLVTQVENGKKILVSSNYYYFNLITLQLTKEGKALEWTREENYKFKLSAVKEKVLSWVLSDTERTNN
jgi:methionyl-tRNA synthetase